MVALTCAVFTVDAVGYWLSVVHHIGDRKRCILDVAAALDACIETGSCSLAGPSHALFATTWSGKSAWHTDECSDEPAVVPVT